MTPQQESVTAQEESLDENQTTLHTTTFMTEQEVVQALANRCTVYRNLCSWEHEPAKSDFFKIFQASPRDIHGIPILSGDKLRIEVKRVIDDDSRWDEIKWILHDVCTAWNQWLYAVKKWKVES